MNLSSGVVADRRSSIEHFTLNSSFCEKSSKQTWEVSSFLTVPYEVWMVPSCSSFLVQKITDTKNILIEKLNACIFYFNFLRWITLLLNWTLSQKLERIPGLVIDLSSCNGTDTRRVRSLSFLSYVRHTFSIEFLSPWIRACVTYACYWIGLKFSLHVSTNTNQTKQ